MEDKTEEWLQENFTRASDNLFRDPVFADALGISEFSYKTLNNALKQLENGPTSPHFVLSQARIIAYIELKSKEHYRSNSSYLESFVNLEKDEDTVEGRITQMLINHQNLPEYRLLENAIKGLLMTSYTAKYGDKESIVEEMFKDLFPMPREESSAIRKFGLFVKTDERVEEAPEKSKRPGGG